ncbi:MAG: MBOAT family protein, partial [Planctomycetaceae bacterium]
MLFNSHVFLFAFLPVTLLVYFVLGGAGKRQLALAWVTATSLVFYGWFEPKNLLLIGCSMICNYALGCVLCSERVTLRLRQVLLGGGIAANIVLLGYYKYFSFFVENLNSFAGTAYAVVPLALPLGISFFTFQQLSYLIDAYRGETREHNFLHYCLFVTFFPHLIAGPLVHHGEMLPQFTRDSTFRPKRRHIEVGLTIFFIGLFKKVVIADAIAEHASPVFAAAEAGVHLTFLEAWCGAIAYTLQLYFDFSAYSDMAIGLARLFGVRLPLNFHSPYKATNIIDFWRRWHMTLSRFLRDYLYIPLGG